MTGRIDPDDWDTWRVNRVTEMIFKGFVAEAAKAKEAWVEASWNGGKTDPVTLALLKGRAEVLLQLADLRRETLEEWNEPDND